MTVIENGTCLLMYVKCFGLWVQQELIEMILPQLITLVKLMHPAAYSMVRMYC